MPDRFLRDGLLTSSRFNDLVPETREFYVRLLLVVDDFGCYDGREGVCASHCYPLKPPSVEMVANMLAQLHTAELIVRYANAGRPFLAITQWKCGMRGRRKFPAPPVDIDLGGYRITGKFDRDVGWRNPQGYDDVSILLDAKQRPVAPQPDEWRPPGHYGPLVEPEVQPQVAPTPKSALAVQRSVATDGGTRGRTVGAIKTVLPATTHLRSHHGSSHLAVDVKAVEHLPVDAGAVAVEALDVPVAPAVPPAENNDASATSGNGLVKIENGGFVGLTEAQRLRWQEMFEWPIPDQIERAAAWLQANHGERAAIERQGEGFESFIFRWLLREDRSHGT